ncbi:hypothetical protein F5B20DRAFT_591105 [Whalleya microplaca]|nr:hypothetical protein F5B20DRAFT_591105 [Whalleya microplaca]
MPPSALLASPLSAGPTLEKTDLSEQREVEAIWKEVHNKVIELAGGDPNNVKKTLDVEGVLKYIDAVQSADKKKSEKFGLFKTIVSRTLQCIQTVGGIVTDGVSEVFAPAGMCYNALTFVIQAWRGYEGIFENLAELLEKCVEFLERLESYQGRMDSKLSRLACQNLRLFVEICDRAIKLRRKHSRLFAFTKQLFLNDNGIQDLLSMMERLNAKESLLVNAQTYRIVSDSAGDIKLLLDTQKEQKKEDEAKKWRRTIAKALGFSGAALDSAGEPIPTWQRAFDARKNTLVDETGKWLLTHEVFGKWTGPTYPAKPVVLVEGRNGSGKTSLMANSLRYIRKMEQGLPTSRIVTAYYFAEGDKRKSDEEDDSGILATLSRTLLWQISTAYEAMTRSVAQIVERTSDFDGSLDLWQQLFINNKERMNPDTTFFIFIDGLDTDLFPLLQRLTSSVRDNKRARIFLTAQSQMISNWLEPKKDVQLDVIPIADYNDDDIDKYITYRMDSMPILKDRSRPGISEWRESILETLRFKCAGDYFKLNTSLDALAKVDLIDDIREVLAEADKTRVDQIDAEIRRLNNIRTVKEIQEINEIILWIESGRRWFPVEMMEALLSVKHHISPMAADTFHGLPLTRRTTGLTTIESTTGATPPATLTISLLPFTQKLVEKYPIFRVTDTGIIDWRAVEMKDRIPSKDLDRNAGFGLLLSSGQHVIHESEIDIVRHFLGNVCPPHLYRRFEFDQFFDAKLGAGNKDYICLDPDNADIKIALTSLVILTEEELRNNKNLRQYAMYWLLDHLTKVDLSAADRDLKAQVGRLLVKLFTEECGIDSMFWPFNLNVSMGTWNEDEYVNLLEARCEWVYSMHGVQEISRWFHDSSVTKYIISEPGLSLVAAVKAPSANLHEAVLSHAAKNIADHLFHRVEFTLRQFLCACCFLRGYLSRLDPERSSQMPNEPPAYKDENSPAFEKFEGRVFQLEEIKEIEAWAAGVLNKSNNTPIQESSWEIHGALIIYQLCDGLTEVYQERARKAVDLNPQNWHACHFIAKQSNTSNEEAADLLSRAKRAVDDLREENKVWIQDHANSSLLARITLDLGDRLWDLGQDYELAARTHRESLQFDYVHFLNYTDVLGRYQKRESWTEFIAFVETLNNTSQTWAAYFDELVNEFVIDLVVRDSDILAQAADATKRWDVIESFFTLAIDIGIQQEAYDLLFILREEFARTLASAANGVHEDKVVAVREAALEDIKLHPSDTVSPHFIDVVSNSLAKIYLDKAFDPTLPTQRVESYGSSIANLLPDLSDTHDVMMNNLAVCCLIRYHQRLESNSKLARDWMHRIVRAGIELLSDEDEENDDDAYWLLARLLTTVGDKTNTRITWTLRNMVHYDAMNKWQSYMNAWDEPAIAKSNTANGDGIDSKLAQSETITNGSEKEPKLGKRATIGAFSNAVEKGGENIVAFARGLRVDTNPIISDTGDILLEQGSSSEVGNTGSDEDKPAKPSWLVSCDGCDKQWTIMDVPLYTCSDCVGTIQLDKGCHALLMDGKLKKKGFRCKKEHSFIEIPEWDPKLVDGMPKGCVPLPDSQDKEKRWTTLDQWKTDLKNLYLDGVNRQATVSPS